LETLERRIAEGNVGTSGDAVPKEKKHNQGQSD